MTRRVIHFFLVWRRFVWLLSCGCSMWKRYSLERIEFLLCDSGNSLILGSFPTSEFQIFSVCDIRLLFPFHFQKWINVTPVDSCFVNGSSVFFSLIVLKRSFFFLCGTTINIQLRSRLQFLSHVLFMPSKCTTSIRIQYILRWMMFVSSWFEIDYLSQRPR